MEKKLRSVYEVEFSAIVSWDEENDFPGDMDLIISNDDVELSYMTANIMEAYRYYIKHNNDLDENTYCELKAREIEVSDEEWMELLNKGELDFNDYSKFQTAGVLRVLAWDFSYEGRTERNDSVLDELLIVQSEWFNMRLVCGRAGINYSTYRGFKNNKQPFSWEKKLELLRTMNAIGNGCWDTYLL